MRIWPADCELLKLRSWRCPGDPGAALAAVIFLIATTQTRVVRAQQSGAAHDVLPNIATLGGHSDTEDVDIGFFRSLRAHQFAAEHRSALRMAATRTDGCGGGSHEQSNRRSKCQQHVCKRAPHHDSPAVYAGWNGGSQSARAALGARQRRTSTSACKLGEGAGDIDNVINSAPSHSQVSWSTENAA